MPIHQPFTRLPVWLRRVLTLLAVVLLAALWFLVGVTGGKLSWLNGYILSQSVGYGIFGSINPFV